MTILRMLFVLVISFGLAACGGGNSFGLKSTTPSVDVTSMAPMRVATFRVIVPQTLSVSEADSYDPRGDIVWRGDPLGPRHAQVKAIMDAGIQKGIARLTGGTPVALDIVVARFHSQSKKIRYSYGGKYEVEYDLTVYDANREKIIIPTYRVVAEIKAPGGGAALAADLAGRTEKMDNIDLIANSIYQQLTGG